MRGSWEGADEAPSRVREGLLGWGPKLFESRRCFPPVARWGGLVDVKKAVARNTESKNVTLDPVYARSSRTSSLHAEATQMDVQEVERTGVRRKDERALEERARTSGMLLRTALAVAEADTEDAEEASLPSLVTPSVAPDSSGLPSSLIGGAFRSEEERATTLVLMESGAYWPSWVKEVQRRAPNSMVEVQSASESVEGFGARALRRLLALRERGIRVHAAVYAAASPASDQERSVRRLLCSTLLDVLADGGELVLSGAGWSTWGVDARSREELMALAGDLSCQLPHTVSGANGRVTVSVRFGEAPDESGVHKATGAFTREALERSAARERGEGDDEEEASLAREIA